MYCGVPQNADIIRDTENTYFYRRASDNHQMTNAGTYHVLYKLDWNTQDVTNVVWEDGSSADVTVTYHIKKAQLSVALPQDLSITYFGGVDIRDKIGTPELLGVLGDDQVTYEITRAELWTKNVGPRDQRFAYMEFSISGTDSENYYVPANCELPVEIKRLQLTIPTPSMNMELYESVRANNFNQTNIDVKDYIVLGALNNLVEGDDVTVKCAEATLFNGNAGPQTVKIYFDIISADRDNYLSPKSVSFTQYIPYSKVPKPTLTADDLVYTGEPLTAKIPTSPYYTITGNVATNAGEYTATLTFNDPDNYRWNEDTKGSIHITWHIAPQVVDKPELNTDDLVYTRSLLTADIDASELYTITNNTATDAGTYYATVALNDTSNYVWNDSLTTAFDIEFHVDKATPTIELLNSFGKSQLDKVYDGIAHSNPIEDVNFTSFSDGVLTIKWLYNESENNVSNKNVGEQILLIKYAESDNYYEKSMEISFEITQKEATLLWTQLTGEALVYNGAEKVLSASVTNLCLTDECTVNVEVVGDNVNVGTFKFKAISLSNANYKLPENVNSDNYTIIPQPVVNPAVPSPVTYNGQVQTVGIEESDLYTISNGSHKDKGNYLVTVSLNDKDNYEWMGTGNGNDITYEFVINAKSLEWKNNVDHLTIASRAYDGTRVVSLSQILWSDIELVLFDGDDVEIDKDLTTAQYNDPYSGQFKDVVVTFKVKGEQANNYDPDSLTLTVTNCEISPKALTVSGGLSSEYTEIVYNGETLLDKEWFEFELVGVENNEAVELDWVANLDSPEPNEAQTITIVFSISGDTSQYYTKPVNATATIKVSKATPTITFENSYFVWSPGFDEEIDEDWLPKTSYIDDYGTQSVVFYEYNEPGDEWNLHYGYSFDDQNKYKFVYSVSGSDRYTSASKEVEFYSYNVKQSIGEGMGEGGYVSSPEVTWSNDMENAIIVQFQYNGRIKDEYCDYAFKFADYDSTNGTMRIIDKFDHEIKPDQDGYYVLNTGTYYIVVECTGSFNLSNHTLFEYRQPYVAAPDPEL